MPSPLLHHSPPSSGQQAALASRVTPWSTWEWADLLFFPVCIILFPRIPHIWSFGAVRSLPLLTCFPPTSLTFVSCFQRFSLLSPFTVPILASSCVFFTLIHHFFWGLDLFVPSKTDYSHGEQNRDMLEKRKTLGFIMSTSKLQRAKNLQSFFYCTCVYQSSSPIMSIVNKILFIF